MTIISIFQGKNCDLEDKLRALTLSVSASEDAMRIELMKSNSPIDPKLGLFGNRTSETLREIEKNREYLLNEQGTLSNGESSSSSEANFPPSTFQGFKCWRKKGSE